MMQPREMISCTVHIYATAAALAHAEPLSSFLSTSDGRGEVRQWLEQVKPEDFSLRLEEEP